MGGQIESAETRVKRPSFGAILLQIALFDIVFSLDSVITAMGMVDNVPIMIAACYRFRPRIAIAILAKYMLATMGPLTAIIHAKAYNQFQGFNKKKTMA